MTYLIIFILGFLTHVIYSYVAPLFTSIMELILVKLEVPKGMATFDVTRINNCIAEEVNKSEQSNLNVIGYQVNDIDKYDEEEDKVNIGFR